MGLLVNIDVPDLEAAISFYCRAFDLQLARRLGAEVAELRGWPAPLYLLQKAAGSIGAATEPRRYTRHWTPVHLDIAVEKIEVALDQATSAGAVVESKVRSERWGKIAVLADPFGHGFCLIEFVGHGYDEIT